MSIKGPQENNKNKPPYKEEAVSDEKFQFNNNNYCQNYPSYSNYNGYQQQNNQIQNNNNENFQIDYAHISNQQQYNPNQQYDFNQSDIKQEQQNYDRDSLENNDYKNQGKQYLQSQMDNSQMPQQIQNQGNSVIYQDEQYQKPQMNMNIQNNYFQNTLKKVGPQYSNIPLDSLQQQRSPMLYQGKDEEQKNDTIIQNLNNADSLSSLSFFNYNKQKKNTFLLSNQGNSISEIDISDKQFPMANVGDNNFIEKFSEMSLEQNSIQGKSRANQNDLELNQACQFTSDEAKVQHSNRRNSYVYQARDIFNRNQQKQYSVNLQNQLQTIQENPTQRQKMYQQQNIDNKENKEGDQIYTNGNENQIDYMYNLQDNQQVDIQNNMGDNTYPNLGNQITGKNSNLLDLPNNLDYREASNEEDSNQYNNQTPNNQQNLETNEQRLDHHQSNLSLVQNISTQPMDLMDNEMNNKTIKQEDDNQDLQNYNLDKQEDDQIYNRNKRAQTGSSYNPLIQLKKIDQNQQGHSPNYDDNLQGSNINNNTNLNSNIELGYQQFPSISNQKHSDYLMENSKQQQRIPFIRGQVKKKTQSLTNIKVTFTHDNIYENNMRQHQQQQQQVQEFHGEIFQNMNQDTGNNLEFDSSGVDEYRQSMCTYSDENENLNNEHEMQNMSTNQMETLSSRNHQLNYNYINKNQKMHKNLSTKNSNSHKGSFSNYSIPSPRQKPSQQQQQKTSQFGKVNLSQRSSPQKEQGISQFQEEQYTNNDMQDNQQAKFSKKQFKHFQHKKNNIKSCSSVGITQFNEDSQVQNSTTYNDAFDTQSMSRPPLISKKFRDKNKQKKDPIDTSHAPINLTNLLTKYLTKIYERVKCKSEEKCNQVKNDFKQMKSLQPEENLAKTFDFLKNSEMCKFCKDMEYINEIKHSKKKNITNLGKFWDSSIRIKKLSEDYLIHQCPYIFVTKNYVPHNRKALISCLSQFVKGNRKPKEFWKLQ